MKSTILLFIIILFSTLVSSLVMAQNPSVEYKLQMPKPWTHVLEIEATFAGLSKSDPMIDLHLPAWRSGRYLIFDLAGFLVGLSAVDGNQKALQWKKVDKATWRIEKNGVNAITARYSIYANDFNRVKNGLDDEHAFVNGAAVFLYSEKLRNVPVRLTVVPYANWHVTTGLESATAHPNTFLAQNYDHLLDCPLLIGNQQDFEFDVDGTPHVLSIHGGGNWRADTLIHDITKIVKTQKDFWGGFPYQRYVFMLHTGPTMGGGTEYLNSTIMGAKPFVFQNPATYYSFLGLVSHEFFHTWNVKQLRPKGIQPYDYTKENYTKELWIAEGTTSYYGPLLRLRAGLTTAKQYLESIATNVKEDRERPGNNVQSLSESSFDAWIKHWKPFENDYNYETDYYGKGANVSLILDLEVRQRSKNKKSLDDVMRTMFKRFPLGGSGYTVDDFQKAAEEMTGGSLRDFFQQFVHGTVPLPWETALAYAGLELDALTKDLKPWLGLRVEDRNEKMLITRVLTGGPGEEAGVSVGDEVVALNGYRVRASELQTRVAEISEGGTVTLTVFRNDKLREISVTIRKPTSPAYKIVKKKEPTKLQRAIFESWLSTTWD